MLKIKLFIIFLVITSCKGKLITQEVIDVKYKSNVIYFFEKYKDANIKDHPFAGYLVTIQNNSKNIFELDSSKAWINIDNEEFIAEIKLFENLEVLRFDQVYLKQNEKREFIVVLPFIPRNMKEAKKLLPFYSKSSFIIRNNKQDSQSVNINFSEYYSDKIIYILDGEILLNKKIREYENYSFLVENINN